MHETFQSISWIYIEITKKKKKKKKKEKKRKKMPPQNLQKSMSFANGQKSWKLCMVKSPCFTVLLVVNLLTIEMCYLQLQPFTM